MKGFWNGNGVIIGISDYMLFVTLFFSDIIKTPYLYFTCKEFQQLFIHYLKIYKIN